MNCKYCGALVNETDYYCHNCGKKLKERPVSLSFLALFWLLILSVLLPPFGIGTTFKYIGDADSRAKIIGWVSLVITIAAMILAVNIALAAVDTFTQQLNNQMGSFL